MLTSYSQLPIIFHNNHSFPVLKEYYILDCGIDGEALKELVSDFNEFSTLVTAPLARLKIKMLVKEFENYRPKATQEEVSNITM